MVAKRAAIAGRGIVANIGAGYRESTLTDAKAYRKRDPLRIERFRTAAWTVESPDSSVKRRGQHDRRDCLMARQHLFTFGGDSMKAYVMTTGVVFGLLTLVHVWRAIVERNLATDPFFILITLAAAALCVWAWRVLRLSARA